MRRRLGRRSRQTRRVVVSDPGLFRAGGRGACMSVGLRRDFTFSIKNFLGDLAHVEKGNFCSFSRNAPSIRTIGVHSPRGTYAFFSIKRNLPNYFTTRSGVFNRTRLPKISCITHRADGPDTRQLFINALLVANKQGRNSIFSKEAGSLFPAAANNISRSKLPT